MGKEFKIDNMKKKENFTSVFLFFAIFALIIFTASRLGFLSFPASIAQKALSPFAGSVYSAFNFFSSPSKDSAISKIKEENRELVKKIVSQSVLQKENVQAHE